MSHTDPPEPTRGTRSTFRRVRHALHPARRTTVALCIVIAILLVTGLIVKLTSGPDTGEHGDRALTAPRTRPDPVPTPKPLTEDDIPKDCGVSPATRTQLVPGDEKAGPCQWYSNRRDTDDCGSCSTKSGGLDPALEMAVRMSDGDEDVSPIGQAMLSIDTLWTQAAAGSIPFRSVTGLGGEAVARYSPGTDQDGGATVVFRHRNALVTISYRSDSSDGQLPEKAALHGALRAAADAAGKLGTDVPSYPRIITPPAGPPALTHVPKPCDAVPETTLDRLVPDANSSREQVPAFGTDIGITGRDVQRTCWWYETSTRHAGDGSREGAARDLVVSVAPFPDLGRGSGTREATRLFHKVHHDARHKQAGAAHPNAFHMLTGPGDQAFGSYETDPRGGTDPAGRVVFRMRNVLVAVQYSGKDGERTISQKQAVNAAYTAAVRVAKSLPA